ncbi:MAG: sporulation protein YunB [Oscillospiraceae bacterium]|nr:sporulation protein YunB [Oscillospiraceae bacterium]
MRFYRQRIYSRKTNIIFFCAAVFVIVLITVIFTERKLRPVMITASQYEAQMQVTDIINECVADIVRDNGIGYTYFSSISYDSGGCVALIEANTGNINLFQSESAKIISKRLKKSTLNTEIALGTLTGISFMSARGPQINVRLKPSNSVRTKIKSEFYSAGINQTCHRISMVITSDIAIITPFDTLSTQVSSECILAETIVVGDTPNYSAIPYDNNRAEE